MTGVERSEKMNSLKVNTRNLILFFRVFSYYRNLLSKAWSDIIFGSSIVTSKSIKLIVFGEQIMK